MTACTNKGGKAGRVITAALVATLSVGAPVVALATTADSGTGDIELMASQSDVVWAGTVTYSGDNNASFVYNGEAQGLEAKTLTPAGTSMEEQELTYTDTLSPSRNGYYYFYVKLDSSSSTTYKNIAGTDFVTYKDSKGKFVVVKGTIETAKPSAIGEYAVVSGYYDGAQMNYVSTAAHFSIKAKSLDGAVLIDDGDVDDTTFAYDGTSSMKNVTGWLGRIGVAVDGVELDEYDSVTSTGDYELQIWKVGGSVAMGPTDALESDTNYVVKIIGKGSYAGQTAQKTFSFGKLDLSTAVIVTKSGIVPPSDSFTTIVKSINDETSLDGTDFKVSFKSGPDGSTVGKKGEYVYTVAAAKDDNKYVTGSQDVKYVYADYAAGVDFTGCQKDTTILPGATSTTVDLSADKPDYFDLSKIKVTYYDGASTIDLDAEDYKVTVLDKDGKEVSADSLKTAGEWTVKVDVNYTDDDTEKVVAGSASFTVTVDYGTVTDANVYVSYDGKNVTSTGFNTPYTGEDMLPGITVKAVKGDKTFEEGTDYEVKVTKAGKEVDQIVDAGMYTITVKGISWNTSETFNFTVSKREIASVEITDAIKIETVDNGGAATTRYEDVAYVAYTGEEIAPTYSFKTTDGKVWEVPADDVTVTYYKDAGKTIKTELKEKGTYYVGFSIDGDSVNFQNPAGTISCGNFDKIVVTDLTSFVDVPNDAWYASAVATAKQQGYIFGVNNSNVFAPDASISRADVVCVLYRMAGGTVQSEDWVGGDNNGGYLTRYSDVDAKAYYAQALAWASKTGVVTGYEDGTFGPSDPVTVEQFATMLARYAKVAGTDTTVDDVDAVLGSVADGAQVSDFARDAVAWAVDGGYLAQGSDIVPQSEVSRGRMITIAVRYQPEQADLL